MPSSSVRPIASSPRSPMKRPEVDDLELLNGALGPALANARIVEGQDGFTWDWADELTLDRMLWPVARSAAELLASAQLERARQCADEKCGWLFLDLSRNRSRRWCSMRIAGTAIRRAATTAGSNRAINPSPDWCGLPAEDPAPVDVEHFPVHI